MPKSCERLFPVVALSWSVAVACADVDAVPRDDGAAGERPGKGRADLMHAQLACPEPKHVAGTAGCLTAAAFDDSIVHSYALTVEPSDLARLPALAIDSDTESTYVPAQLRIDGEEVGKVGLRFKGAYGTLHTCIDEDLTLSCPKMSYKVKFDEFDPDKRWKALKKVNLHSMSADDTLMHEHLAYSLFRDMGIAAPRAAHAQVTINGEVAGLYAQTEAPDGRFTADRFEPLGDGNLYKEVWPVSTEADYFQADLETNEDEEQDHAAFIAFSRALRSASTAELPQVLARFTDVDYLLRYMAVDRITSNWDGVTAFYCGDRDGEHCGNHNMYWYLDEAGERFWLVPWDLDNTWALQTVHDTVMPAWNETPADCEERIAVYGNWLMPAGCDPLFRALAGVGEGSYRAALEQMLEGPFQAGALEAEIDRIARLITPAVRADAAIDFSAWQGSVQGLRDDVGLLREKAQLLAAGRDVAPFGLRTDAVNDFEGTANVTFALGSRLDPNPGTSVSRSIHEREPIRGEADVRTDFVFRTASTAHTWLNFEIAMRDAPADLSAVKHVRLTLRADGERSVRVELDSKAYDDPYSGVRFGWDIEVGAEPTTFTLAMSALAPRAGAELEEDPDSIAAATGALMFQVNSHGLDDEGFFPAGESDAGFLQIDDLEFIH
jgi:spore coat protein H